MTTLAPIIIRIKEGSLRDLYQVKECMEGHCTLFLALSGSEAHHLAAKKAEEALQKAMMEQGYVYICLMITAHDHVYVPTEDVAARMQMPCVPCKTEKMKEIHVEHCKDVPDVLIKLCNNNSRPTKPVMILTSSVGCSIKSLARNICETL